MAFLDPTMPIATSDASDCTDFFVGGAAVLAAGWLPLAVWIAICFGFFGLLEIRVMCSHCPHYAEEGSTLKCWANHGSPKLWKYRPGPMSVTENVLFVAGLVAVWGYPVPFMAIGGRWFLLGLYLLLSAGFFATLKLFLCTQCMNFACPLNAVPNAARSAFFQRNPLVDRAWNAESDERSTNLKLQNGSSRMGIRKHRSER